VVGPDGAGDADAGTDGHAAEPEVTP
jgi:hypothetical protein